MMKRDPFQPVDEDARLLAQQLIKSASFAALGVLDNGAPAVTRIALGITPDGRPLSLVSDLSSHTRALRANPTCSLLVGEPGPKGDPLTHPRLTISATARFVARDSTDHTILRGDYLSQNPKAQLYIDFADFHLVRFDVASALLNGGFGKACQMTAADLTQV